MRKTLNPRTSLILISIILLFLAVTPFASATRQLNTLGSCSHKQQFQTVCQNNVGNVNAARPICDRINAMSSRAELGVISSLEQFQRAKAFCKAPMLNLVECFCGSKCDPAVMFDGDLWVWGQEQNFIDAMNYISLLVQQNTITQQSVQLPSALAPDVNGLTNLYNIDYALSPDCKTVSSAPVVPITYADCTPAYVETATCKFVSAGELVYDPISQAQITPGGERGCSDTPQPLNQEQKLIEITSTPEELQRQAFYCPAFYCTQNPLLDNNGNQIGTRCATPCYKSSDGIQVCCPNKYIDPSATNPNLGKWTGPGTSTNPIPPACNDFCNLKVCTSCLLGVDTSSCQASPTPTPPPDTGGGSPPSTSGIPSPLIYSLTPSGAEFEGPALGLQFSSIMDKPYYLQLKGFDSTTGSIVISEPFPETTYLSNVQLIGVTSKATPLMTGDGQILTIGNPLPVSCIAKDGSDCSGLIVNKDSLYIKPISTLSGEAINPDSYGKTAYSTNLKSINLEDSSTYTDFIELTLPATNSGFAKLVIDYSMSPKCLLFEQGFARDYKSLLPLIYGSLENPEIGDFVSKKMLQQLGFAKLYVMDENGNWKQYPTKGLISYTNKEEAMLLDLSKVPQNKVRIQFLSGLFAVDRIAVDYSPDEIAQLNYYGPQDSVAGQKISEGQELTVSFNTQSSTDTAYFLNISGYFQPGILSQKDLELGSVSLDPNQLYGAATMMLSKDYAAKYVLKLLLG